MGNPHVGREGWQKALEREEGCNMGNLLQSTAKGGKLLVAFGWAAIGNRVQGSCVGGPVRPV